MKPLLQFEINNETAFLKKKTKNICDYAVYKAIHNYSIMSAVGYPLNTIWVPKDVYLELRYEEMVLLNSSNNKYINVEINYASSLSGEDIGIANYVLESVDACSPTELVLLKNKKNTFSKLKLQRIDNIKEDYIVISSKDINEQSFFCGNFSLFQVTNIYTRESIILKKSHIKIDSQLEKGTIRLNRKQRAFLGVNLPKCISKVYWDTILTNLSQNAESLSFLKTYYSEDDHILQENISYETQQKLQKILSTACPPTLNISPIIQSYDLSEKRGVLTSISDFYVGKATIPLLCRRPYESDEGMDVVRMTLSNMNLLGIAEMDQVIITYKNRSVKCRVLKLDDKDDFRAANQPTPLNYSIGIPVHIRKVLGITDVNTTVKVDRDTKFIFRKSINEQIVPILLTLFSVNLFQDPSIWKKVLLSICAIPIVVFFNLSSKRNLRG